jgi:hypothetical protein
MVECFQFKYSNSHHIQKEFLRNSLSEYVRTGTISATDVICLGSVYDLLAYGLVDCVISSSTRGNCGGNEAVFFRWTGRMIYGWIPNNLTVLLNIRVFTGRIYWSSAIVEKSKETSVNMRNKFRLSQFFKIQGWKGERLWTVIVKKCQ